MHKYNRAKMKPGQLPYCSSMALLVLRKISTCLFLAIVFIAHNNTLAQSGTEIYSAYCGGCHGDRMQGSVASALVKPTWKYGSDRNSIIRNITNGIPSTTMISWKDALSAKEIESVTDYILKAQTSSDAIETIDKPLTVNTELYSLNIEKYVTEGLDGPWGFEFVDGNTALITGKKGDLYWIVNGKVDERKITERPKFV